MRIYLTEGATELKVDLIETIRHGRHLTEFKFVALSGQEIIHREQVFIRKLAMRYFASSDGKVWEGVPALKGLSKVLHIDKVFDLKWGYKPLGGGEGEESTLTAQMPGKVVKVAVSEGDHVNKGDTLLVLEAMKMENEIKSKKRGQVVAIHCREGQTLDKGALMIELSD